ncbi:MAG: disulfide oxidoreductase [Patescibacteria group bacterium]
MEIILIVNQTLSLLTVAGQIIIVVLIASLATKRSEILNFFAKHALSFSLLVALIATLGSLFYSEIAGYDPCKLCWFQRILMYPQVILIGIAWLKKDYGIVLYSIVLSSLGALIAGYHYLLQIGIASSIGCSAVGYSINCAQRFVMQFGYITIPMMAFTAFLLIISFMVVFKKSSLSIKIK